MFQESFFFSLTIHQAKGKKFLPLKICLIKYKLLSPGQNEVKKNVESNVVSKGWH